MTIVVVLRQSTFFWKRSSITCCLDVLCSYVADVQHIYGKRMESYTANIHMRQVLADMLYRKDRVCLCCFKLCLQALSLCQLNVTDQSRRCDVYHWCHDAMMIT